MRAGIFSTLMLAAVVSANADETMTVLKVESDVYTNTSVKSARPGSSGPVRTDEKIAVLKAGNETYSNITVTTVSATDVYFTYAGGMGNVKIKKLSPELQQHFNFDPNKAKEVELQQAANKEKYHEQLLHQPAAQAPDMTRDPTATVATAPADEPVWRHNLAMILHHAQVDNKKVLLDFSGSDWSEWSMKFEQDVLTTAKFAAYSGQKLIIVRVDFPRNTQQSDDLKRANVALADQFKVNSFPTYLLLDPSGIELGRQVGYLPGGPDAFISKLEEFGQH